MNGQYRTETDSMGPMQVPADAYYGASTMRAIQNFPISDLRFPRVFIRALGLIKQAAARVNRELGLLDSAKGEAIERAAEAVAEGRFDSEFVVDVFQTGSGTSTNMNANEVIAALASEALAGHRGERRVHPNDEVNLGQSSNDVIPSAIHIATLLAVRDELRPALAELQRSLKAKSDEFWPVIKTGRTHLQDATPIRLGQEFLGYSGQVGHDLRRLEWVEEELRGLALGGTAVGTGINCHPEFPRRVVAELSHLTGLGLSETDNHFLAQSSIDSLVAASGVLKVIAVSLAKIADDIRWLGSGPRAGLGELHLPEVQPGSSIMPGKVNPVIAESLLQVCALVIGNDATLTQAGRGSHFELNMMLPVAAYCLLQSVSLLASASLNFSRQCVEGLTATPRGPELVEKGLALATALAPKIGYDAAAGIAKEAASTGRSVREVALERAGLSEAELDAVLDPAKMVEAGL